MLITIEKQDRATVTIDTKSCAYLGAVRKAIELALELDGYGESSVDEIFGRMPEVKCELDETASR